MKRIILNLSLILYIILILFLSFQPGGDTADTSMRVTNFILSIFIKGDIPYETIEYWHMTFRLLAHPVIFCIYALLAMLTAREFMKKARACITFAATSGIFLAVLTEVGKWNIPGRHFDLEEMCLNAAGVVSGLLVYLVIAKIATIWNKDRITKR